MPTLQNLSTASRWFLLAAILLLFALFAFTVVPPDATGPPASADRATVLPQLRPDTIEGGPLRPAEMLAPDRFRMRVGGDVVVADADREGAVVVIDGNAIVEGAVDAVVVVDGRATLRRADVGTLVVVDGTADLSEGTVIRRNVHLVASDLRQTDDVIVGGDVETGMEYPIARGLLLFGVLVALGGAIAVIAAGLIAAAVAPHKMREMGARITGDIGATALAGLAVWVGLPMVAAALFATLIGIPIALGILFVLLPGIAMIGYIVSGIRLGDYVMGRFRGRDEAWHPYRAAVSGLALLLVAGWLPFLGGVVTPVAVFLGGGAVGLTAWKAVRWPKSAAGPTNPPDEPELAVHRGP